jgi:hypothetical protein
MAAEWEAVRLVALAVRLAVPVVVVAPVAVANSTWVAPVRKRCAMTVIDDRIGSGVANQIEARVVPRGSTEVTRQPY